MYWLIQSWKRRVFWSQSACEQWREDAIENEADSTSDSVQALFPRLPEAFSPPLRQLADFDLLNEKHWHTPKKA